MSTKTDYQQLELIKRSLFEPSAEDEAKRLLLREIYEIVAKAYRERAPNGGALAPLPSCVREALETGRPCRDDAGFTYNAIRVLMARYLTRDEYGRFMETPSMVMRRVSLGFSGRVDPERLYRVLVERRFMFNSPTLFNMYTDGARGTLSACYVTPVHDDMRAIMDAATVQALTFKWGGGQGFSFSELRPRWDIVRGTSGYASGPLSFMRIYDVVTEMVKQGGKRRGANMGIMHAWHPDIYNPGFNPWHALRNALPPQLQALIDSVKRVIEYLEREGYEIDPAFKEMVEKLSEQGWSTVEDAGFIQAKEPPLQDANLTNFNISVAANDAFMEAVIRDEEWWMINPRFSEDPATGVYRLHHTVSRATGLGRLGELVEKHEWLLQSPYLNIYEDVAGEARRKALEEARRAGYSPEEKNPYTWRYPARRLWEKIVENAWAGGDPGLFYPDNHNKWNPTPWLGAVYATNPCVSRDTVLYCCNVVVTAGQAYGIASRSSPVGVAEGFSPVYPASVLTLASPVHPTVVKTFAGIWRVGERKGYRIRLSNGVAVTVTPEHRFMTISGDYVEAREIHEMLQRGEKPPKLLYAIVDLGVMCSKKPRLEKWLLEAAENLARGDTELMWIYDVCQMSVIADLLSDKLGSLKRFSREYTVVATILSLFGYRVRDDGSAEQVHVGAYPVEVVGSEEVVDEFYDFTVPGTHNYLAAGLVHHNCGEQPLYPFESCNLGSMSLDKYVKNGRFDIEAFMHDVQIVVDAMDAVIDLNKHPDERQSRANLFTRKIGLGVMGLADALAELGYPYDSDEAVAFTLIVMAALEVFSWKRSWELGAKLGHAPAFECKRYDWRSMRCLERGEPEELLELHTPALVKAAKVMDLDDDWVRVRYHDIELPQDIRERISGEARRRVEPDGAIRLVPVKVLEKVAREVFGISRDDYWQALQMSPVMVANSPRHLLALAVYNPGAAWETLKTYGRLLGARAPRNTVMTTVAPTGTISIIAGTSSGIEPYFALVYKRRVTVGEFLEVVRPFRARLLEAARRHRVPEKVVQEIYEAISRHKGSLRWALEEVRDRLLEAGFQNGFLAEIERLAKQFPMSMDFDVWYHLAHQIAAQLYVDQAISKTVNLRKEAPRDEVYTAYLVAWLGGLKGVTVYRDESKGVQVIYFGGEQRTIPSIPIRKRRQQKKTKKMRMIHLKKRMKLTELERDEKASELFEAKVVETTSGEVVVELTENSTCKTCEI